MVSEIEHEVSTALRRLLHDQPVGELVPDAEQSKCLFRHLERLIDSILREANDDWDDHCDGIVPVAAIKTAGGGA